MTIAPRRGGFGDDAAAHLSAGAVIYYTTDGTVPTTSSPVYTAPFVADNITVKAISVLGGEQSPVMEQQYGYVKKGWTVSGKSGEKDEKYPAEAILDANPRTFWVSGEMPGAWIAVDMDTAQQMRGFAYTPQTAAGGEGMIEQGNVQVSDDGKKWRNVGDFEFGNLINDPVTRYHWFKKPVRARYIRINATHIAGDSEVAAIAELDIF